MTRLSPSLFPLAPSSHAPLLVSPRLTHSFRLLAFRICSALLSIALGGRLARSGTSCAREGARDEPQVRLPMGELSAGWRAETDLRDPSCVRRKARANLERPAKRTAPFRLALAAGSEALSAVSAILPPFASLNIHSQAPSGPQLRTWKFLDLGDGGDKLTLRPSLVHATKPRQRASPHVHYQHLPAYSRLPPLPRFFHHFYLVPRSNQDGRSRLR
jgi:hypothetical protein